MHCIYYIYFDGYGNCRKAVTGQELELKYGNDPEVFRMAVAREFSESGEGCTRGHVSVVSCDGEKGLAEFLESIGDDTAAGFFDCRADSRPYNF